MSDRNEIFRIILEGRDRLSGQLDGARGSVDKLNKSLDRLKKQKVDEFPLFGGGSARRGPGGRFISNEDLRNVERAGTLVERLDRKLLQLKKDVLGVQQGFGGTQIGRDAQGRFIALEKERTVVEKLRGRYRELVTEIQRSRAEARKPDEFPLFGGGKAVRGPGGQFVKQEDITLIDRANSKVEILKNKLRSLRRDNDEFPLFGGGRATRGPGGQFIKVEEITLMERARRVLRQLGNDAQKFRTENEQTFALFGGGKAIQGPGGQFVKVEEISKLQRLKNALSDVKNGVVDLRNEMRKTTPGGPDRKLLTEDEASLLAKITNGWARLNAQIDKTNRKVVDNRKAFRENAAETAKGFKRGFELAKETGRILDERTGATKEAFRRRLDEINDAEKEQILQISTRQDILRAAESRERFARGQRMRDEIRDNKELIRILKAKKSVLEDYELSLRDELIQEHGGRRIAIRDLEEQIQLIREKKRRIDEEFQQEIKNAGIDARQETRRTFREARRDLEKPNFAQIEREEKQRRRALLDEQNGFRKLGFLAGQAFGDIARGARRGSRGMKDMRNDVGLVNNAFTRFGAAVGGVLGNFNQFVNLRWLFITGILSTFFTLLVQVGTALVAVGASAVQAGAALGGAFVAGAAQALPVVGLLAAAFNRFNVVLDALKQKDKAKAGTGIADQAEQQIAAVQRLQDAQYTLKKAIENLSDAQYDARQASKDVQKALKDQRQATEDLRDAKIQAARDIVDANFEERDAALSLKEAELEVLDAKKKLREEEKKQAASTADLDEARAAVREAQQRLQISRAQGDQSEISAATQQLSLAEQNLSAIQDQIATASTDIRDAQLGVKRAQLARDEARVRDKRAREDAKKARREGVEGSDVVKNAEEQLKNAIEGVAKAQRQVVLSNRNVRDAIHQVAIAHREVADAERAKTKAKEGSTKADETAKKAFEDLAPAEKKLFKSLERIRATYKRVFAGDKNRDGILAPITLAISRIIDLFEKMLRDPKIQKALSTLAKAIGAGIDSIGKFASTKQFRDDLIFFVENAAKNVPKIIEGAIDLFKILLRVARAATPLFNRLLDRFVGTIGRGERATRGGPTRRPEEGGVGVATIRKDPLTNFFDQTEKHLDSVIKLTVAVGRLLKLIIFGPAASSGKSLIDDITDALNHWSDWLEENDVSVSRFFEKNAKAIENLGKTFGRVVPALIEAFSSDDFTNFARVFAEILVPGLVVFVRVLGRAAKILLDILDIPVVGTIVKWALTFAIVERSLNKVFPVTQKFTNLIKLGLMGAFRTLGKVISTFSLRPIALLFDGLRLKIMYAREAMIKWAKTAAETVANAAKSTAERVKTLATRLSEAASQAGPKLREAFTRATAAIGGMAATARTTAAAIAGRLIGSLRALVGFIRVQLVRALLFLRLNIRLLLGATGIGALILAGILLIENWDKVKKYAAILAEYLVKKFKVIVDWIRDNWKTIGKILIAVFVPGGLVVLAFLHFRKQILGIFTDIKDGIINRFKQAFAWIRQKVADLGGWVTKKLKSIPLVGRFFGGDDKEKPKVIQLTVEDKTKAEKIPTKRATGGVIPGSGVLDNVPALLTPGEWVLNKRQQERLSAVLGVSMQQIKAMLFGTNSKTRPQSSSPQATRGFRPGYKKTAMMGSSPQMIRGAKQAGRKVISYSDFNLVSEQDPSGVMVYFLELANGTFGQVTARDAEKIQNNHGTWIPNYVKRSVGGFNQNIKKIVIPGSHFSLGGVVNSPAVQRFAAGGIVQAPGSGNSNGTGNTINQNFSVRTEGSTDWGYVMRLAAVNAQESF